MKKHCDILGWRRARQTLWEMTTWRWSDCRPNIYNAGINNEREKKKKGTYTAAEQVSIVNIIFLRHGTNQTKNLSVAWVKLRQLEHTGKFGKFLPKLESATDIPNLKIFEQHFRPPGQVYCLHRKVLCLHTIKFLFTRSSFCSHGHFFVHTVNFLFTWSSFLFRWSSFLFRRSSFWFTRSSFWLARSSFFCMAKFLFVRQDFFWWPSFYFHGEDFSQQFFFF